MNILFFQIEDASGQRPYPISILQSSRATRPTLGPHYIVPSHSTHHTVPSHSPITQSPLYSPTYTAITLGKTVTLLPTPTTLFLQ